MSGIFLDGRYLTKCKRLKDNNPKFQSCSDASAILTQVCCVVFALKLLYSSTVLRLQTGAAVVRTDITLIIW